VQPAVTVHQPSILVASVAGAFAASFTAAARIPDG
jgi:hypothetical protein